MVCVSWFALKFWISCLDEGWVASPWNPETRCWNNSTGKRHERWHNRLQMSKSFRLCTSDVDLRGCAVGPVIQRNLADNTTFKLRWFVPQKLWGEMRLATWLLPLFPPRQIRDSLPGVSWMSRVETGERLWQPNTEPSSLFRKPTNSRSCN